jgi:hypothetical protein
MVPEETDPRYVFSGRDMLEDAITFITDMYYRNRFRIAKEIRAKNCGGTDK